MIAAQRPAHHKGLHGEAVNADLHARFIAVSLRLLGPEGRVVLRRARTASTAFRASDRTERRYRHGAVILDQSFSMRDMLQQARLG